MFAEVNQRIYELCVDLLGADALVGYDYTMRRSEALGLVGPPGSARKMFLRSRANSIEGGTSEIQRNILGERILGLPGDVRARQGTALVEGPPELSGRSAATRRKKRHRHRCTGIAGRACRRPSLLRHGAARATSCTGS